jgi:holo-[acyl-carrier protein] synthase
MMIHGIGIDVVEVARISASLEKLGEAFLSRICTAAERDYCLAHAVPAIHLAARFAAKEAVAKAFGTGIGKHAALIEIEVCNTASGAPEIVLHGAAAAYAAERGISRVLVSLTHTDHYAAANAVAVS